MKPDTEHMRIRTKVCVIDTGFHQDDPAGAKIIFKDFVSPKNSRMQDNTWHGTLSSTIIMSMYDQCDLYVARVFATNDTDESTEPILMADVSMQAVL